MHIRRTLILLLGCYLMGSCWGNRLSAADADTVIAGIVLANWPGPDSPYKRIEILNDKAMDLHETEFEAADKLARLAYEWAAHYHYHGQVAQAYKALGLVAYYWSDPAESECYQLAALETYREIGDSLGMTAVLNNIGLLYNATGKCQQASEGYVEGLEMSRELGDTVRQLILGINYIESLGLCRQHQLSVEEALRLLPVAMEAGYLNLCGHLYAKLGFAYYMVEEDSLALEALYEGLWISDQTEDKHLEGGLLNSLGLVYHELGDYSAAITYLQESICIDDSVPTQTTRMSSYVNLGQTLTAMGRYEEAQEYFDQALAHYREEGMATYLPETHLSLARNYMGLRQWKDAAEHFQEYSQTLDSVASEEIQAEVRELNQRYQTEKIAHRLTQVELEMRTQRNRLITLIALMTGGFVVVLGTYLLVFSVMKRKKAEAEKRQIELEYIALRAQMNPHFIFNALNSIQGYFSEHDFASGNEYLGAFGQLMRSVLEQSSRTHITLQEELETLEVYLQLEQVRLKKQLSYSIGIDPELDTSMFTLPPLVLQPFIENAIWHGIAPKKGAGHILIQVVENGDLLQIIIEDDGIGIEASSQKKKQPQHVSRGIQITEERLGPDGNLEIESLTDASGSSLGTRVTLSIPQHYD